MTLNKALDDMQFCNELDALNLTFCYQELDEGEERYKLYQSLEEEGINPFSNMTEIFKYMFYSCESLTNLVVPHNITTIGYWGCAYCDNLESVIIPDSVTNIDSYAFFNCTGLKTITIPNSVKSINYSAFVACKHLSINFSGTKSEWKTLTAGKEIFTGGTYECKCVDGIVKKGR